ncbi:hypothetical protein [Kitasatospora sp. P5_F3]
MTPRDAARSPGLEASRIATATVLGLRRLRRARAELTAAAAPQLSYADRMSSDSTGAAADLADALDDFTKRTAAPGAARDVWPAVGGPHDLQQRTVQAPADAADRITEVLRAELGKFDQAPRPDGDQGDDIGDTSEWWG